MVQYIVRSYISLYICITNLAIITKTYALMTQNKRIISVITYYHLQRWKERGKLRKLISEKCEFKGGTFDYRITKEIFSDLELDAIEKIIQDHKDGKIKVL